LAYTVTPANRNDVTQLMPLLDRVGPVSGRRGRPRQRPDIVYADRGYDHDKCRLLLHARGVRHQIASRNTQNGSGLGRVRWVVARTFAWLHAFKRLTICYERRSDLHEAFLAIGCALICWRQLPPSL
jgi:transposase